MKHIVRILVFNLLKRKSVLLTVLTTLIAIGIFSSLSYQNFLYLQAQNISQLSVFNEVIKPLSGLIFLAQLIIISLVSSQLMPYLCTRGQNNILLHSSLSNSRFIYCLFFVIFIFSLMPLFYFFLISLSYLAISNIDALLLLTNFTSLLFGNILFIFFALPFSLLFKKGISSFILVMAVMISALLIDESLRHQSDFQSLSLYLNLFTHFRDGLIVFNEILVILLWILFFYNLSKIVIARWRHSNTGHLRNLFIVLVFIIANNLLNNSSLLEQQEKLQWDISKKQISSLEQNIANKIESVSTPIILTAVIDDKKNHDEIYHAASILRQYSPKLELKFSNRQALNNRSTLVDQFVMVSINDQHQSIRYPFDESAKNAIAKAIISLSSRNNQWITFLEGHGESSPFSQSNRDSSIFYQYLRELSWPIAVQNLSKQPTITNNTKILIIANSRTQWLSGETNAVIDYLKNGGNLLLLREVDDTIPQQITSLLGIDKMEGSLIDWQGYQSGTPHPAILIINQFVKHPINTGITSLLAFPWSVGLTINKGREEKDFSVVLKTHSGVWNEFNSDKTELSYNPENGEKRKEFVLAYAIHHPKNNQRIVVIGDSSFIADSAVNNYANKQFAINLISWLSAQPFNHLTKTYTDDHIILNQWGHLLLKWVFPFILPMLLLLIILARTYSFILIKKYLKTNRK